MEKQPQTPKEILQAIVDEQGDKMLDFVLAFETHKSLDTASSCTRISTFLGLLKYLDMRTEMDMVVKLQESPEQNS
jgi:uncharacterized protein YcgI (DUF1989 family)